MYSFEHLREALEEEPKFRRPLMWRLRDRIRRWLGVTELEEPRSQIAELQHDVRANDANDDMRIEQIADLAARLSRVDRAAHFGGDALQRRLAALEQELHVLRLATGGIWKTADGDVLMIRQMSDNHLQNAIDYPGVSVAQLALLRREQIRRNGDDRWHERYGKTSPRKLLEQLVRSQIRGSERIERLEAQQRQPAKKATRRKT